MTPKELLYVEDALGHTQFLMKQAQEIVNTNQQLFTQFLNLI